MMRENKKPFLLQRQKILLALLDAFDGYLSATDFQKYLFLFLETRQKNKIYEFVPYHLGCFSFQSYADRRYLIAQNIIIAQSRDWKLVARGDYLADIPQTERDELLAFARANVHLQGDDLIKHVYRKYPYYAINSTIAEKHMTSKEFEMIRSARPKSKGYAFFTIGYEGRNFDGYLNTLIKNSIQVLCDVRKNPISRKYGFSKATLAKNLPELGIAYEHIPELGIASEKRKEVATSKDYTKLFSEYERTTLKQNAPALEKLKTILKKQKRVAITCFEADYSMCHRGRIAKALQQSPDWNYDIQHI